MSKLDGFGVFSDEEMNTFTKYLSKTMDRESDWGLKMRGSQYSVDTDCLIYIDDQRVDTAFMSGAEAVMDLYLSEDEQALLMQKGYIISNDKMFAFGVYLMGKFIEAGYLLKASDRNAEQAILMLKNMTGEIGETFDSEKDRIEQQL